MLGSYRRRRMERFADQGDRLNSGPDDRFVFVGKQFVLADKQFSTLGVESFNP